jgi:S-adenosylmethionine:tRNA ribosyltransferase-isomerase
VRLSEFDYELPADRIAQEPARQRDGSLLMVLEGGTGPWTHHVFSDLPDLVSPRDLLVLNDTRVVPARVRGRKPTGGVVDILLLRRIGGPDAAPVYRCLLDASKPTRASTEVRLGEGFAGRILGRAEDGWDIELHVAAGSIETALERHATMPLPPYIRRSPGDGRLAEDRDRYQTVYAREPGAVAAPTAGLHFTEALLRRIAARGTAIATLTLHVGPGTFLPVRSERVEEHVMHAEDYRIPEATADAVESARRRGGRVVAVGTTVARALEGACAEDGMLRAGSGSCDLFIRPGYRFKAVDALITNFHLPRSTLLMLVCAFAGRERILAAYAEAVRRGYRFYSYGDAMFLAGRGC